MTSCQREDEHPGTDADTTVTALASQYETSPERVRELVAREWATRQLEAIADALVGPRLAR